MDDEAYDLSDISYADTDAMPDVTVNSSDEDVTESGDGESDGGIDLTDEELTPVSRDAGTSDSSSQSSWTSASTAAGGLGNIASSLGKLFGTSGGNISINAGAPGTMASGGSGTSATGITGAMQSAAGAINSTVQGLVAGLTSFLPIILLAGGAFLVYKLVAGKHK